MTAAARVADARLLDLATRRGALVAGEVAAMATELISARKWRPDGSAPPEGTLVPANVGHDGAWVSGPRRSTEGLATVGDGGPRGLFTLCLYHDEQDGGTDGRRVYWVDFELFEVLGAGPGSVLEYQRRGSSFGPDPVTELSEAEVAARGFVKWDGCTQFRVADVHVDGRDGLDQLLRAIAEARRRCALAMPWSDVAREYRDG